MLLLGIGMVLAFEGLVLAVAPRRVEQVMELFARLSVDLRRGVGLGALALGVVLIALARRHWG